MLLEIIRNYELGIRNLESKKRYVMETTVVKDLVTPGEKPFNLTIKIVEKIPLAATSDSYCVILNDQLFEDCHIIIRRYKKNDGRISAYLYSTKMPEPRKPTPTAPKEENKIKGIRSISLIKTEDIVSENHLSSFGIKKGE